MSSELAQAAGIQDSPYLTKREVNLKGKGVCTTFLWDVSKASVADLFDGVESEGALQGTKALRPKSLPFSSGGTQQS